MAIKLSGWKLNLGLISIYTVITIIVTWPAINGLIYPYTAPGDGVDIRYFLWHLWWIKRAILELGVSPIFTQAIFYPTGGTLVLTSPFNELASLTFLPLLGTTRTYTLLLFISFPVAALTTYLLTFYLTRQRWAAFMGGLIFAFSARHYAHDTHLGLWVIQWAPLYTLALFLFINKPSTKSAILVAITFILAVTSEHVHHVLFFVMPVTGFFILYHIVSPQFTIFKRPKLWLKLAAALIVGSVLVLPIYPHILQSQTEGFLKRTGLVYFSPDVLNYFLPARSHPVFGSMVEPIYEEMNKPDNKNQKDTTVFVGYTALALASAALLKQPKGQTRFWFMLGIIAFIFSLGPILSFLGRVDLSFEDYTTHIAMPYALLVNLPFISVVRTPGRLSVVAQLAVAVLAAYGLAALTKDWRGAKRIISYTALAAFILFESLYRFPYPVDRATMVPPQIYQQIAQENNNLAVLEVPAQANRDVLGPYRRVSEDATFYYMYYATIHRHPLVGGIAGRTPPESAEFIDTTAFVRELMYPASLADGLFNVSATPLEQLTLRGAEVLARHNIGYVIVHRDRLAEQLDEAGRNVPEEMLRQALGQPFYDDGTIVGFRAPPGDTSAPPQQEALLWGDGWYPESAPLNQPVQWMGQNGSLLVYSPQPHLARLDLAGFSPMSNYVEVSMTVNGAPVETFDLAPTPTWPETHLTRAFSLVAGRNYIQLQATPVGGAPEQPLDPRVYLALVRLALQPVTGPADVSPANPRQVKLADKIAFIGYDQNSNILRQGDTLNLALYWRSLAQMNDSYSVFIHLLDPNGAIKAQRDSVPQDWTLPTTSWGAGEVIVDHHQLPIPPDTPAGQYEIRIGMYSLDTMERLPIVSADSATAENSILLGTIAITN